MKQLLFILTFVIAGLNAQADILKDFDSLGGNDVLVERAKLLQPDKKISVVQKRIVDRRWRHEFTGGYSNNLGGDAYLQTQGWGTNYYLHINPYVAVGLGYFSSFNKLSKEGRYLIDNDKLIPDVDELKEGRELVVNGFPMYGKVNLLDLGVLHFDFYGLASYGDVSLKSGRTNSYSFGGGIGMWISQYITARAEIRQRFYKAQRYDTSVNMDITTASFSLGVLL